MRRPAAALGGLLAALAPWGCAQAPPAPSPEPPPPAEAPDEGAGRRGSPDPLRALSGLAGLLAMDADLPQLRTLPAGPNGPFLFQVEVP